MATQLFWANLSIPPARNLNGTATGADKRQLQVAGSRNVVPLVYGEDRIGARILNVLKAADNTDVLVHALWCFAGDSVNDVRFNDLALPAGATITHYTGSQTTADSVLVAAFAAQSITFTDTLNGYMYSVLRLPSAQFSGALKLTARVRGRKLYDPRKDSTNGGTGSHRLATPSTWEWSQNPSLALADWLVNTTYGAREGVIWSSVATAANANDATVGSPAEARRRIGIAFVEPATLPAMRDTMRAYAGCFLLPEEAGMRLVPDADGSTVATFSHASGDIARIEPLALRDLGDSPTAVEVFFTNTAQIPWADDSAVASLPGAGTTLPWRLSQVRLPGVQRYSQAYREAVERLNKLTLQDLSFSMEVFDRAIGLQVADLIEVTHPIGLSSKKCRVTGIDMPAAGRWRLQLLEHDPASYSSTVVTQPTYTNSGLLISDAEGGAGVDGLSTYTATIYRQATTQPDPASGGSYTFDGDVLVPPDGTTRAIPTSSATPTWATSYTFQTRTPGTAVPGPVGAGDADIATRKLITKPSGTTAIDASPSARTLTSMGDCAVSTDYTFGGVAMFKSPAGAAMAWPASSDWDLNRSEWQWDFVFLKTTSANSLVARRQPSTTNGWAICDDSLRMKINGTWSDTAMLWTRPANGTLNYLTVCKLGTSMYVTLNGTLVATLTGVSTIGDINNPLWFFVADNGSENPANGYFLARFSHKATNTANWTPPTSFWPTSSESGTGWPAWVRVLRDGADGAGLVLLATSQTFTYSGAGAAVPTSQTITFTAVTTLAGTPTFTGTLYDASGTSLGAATLGGSGSSRTLTVANFGTAQYAVISVSLSGYSDQVTVVRLKDGGNVVALLTNESATVAAAADGTVSSFTGTGGTFKVFDGLTDKTGDAAVTYSVVGTPTGVTISIASTGVYTITALSTDTGTATLRAVYGGVTIDKVYSISKAKAGAAGTDAIAASLSTYQLVFTADAGGAVDSGQSYPVTVRVMQGASDVTSSWIVSATPSDSSLTASVSGATITVTANDNNVENDFVDVSITRTGYVTQTARIGVSKLRRATTGPTSGYLSDLGTSVIYAYADSGTAIATLFIETDGRFRQQVNGGTIENVPYAAYYLPTTSGVGTGTWCRVTKLNGGTLSAGSVGSWQQLTSQLEYRAQLSGTGDRLVKLKIEPASGSGGTPLLGTGYVDLQVEYG